jgi:hypothetical protein
MSNSKFQASIYNIAFAMNAITFDETDGDGYVIKYTLSKRSEYFLVNEVYF